MSAAAKLAAFREARRAYLGGTDIAAIIGVSTWTGPVSIYLDKVAPEQADDKDSLLMRRGLALERFITDEFERARPGLVCFHPKPIVRTDWGFPAGASVDRLVATAAKPRTPIAVLECKTAFRNGWRDWDEENADLPDSYYVQQQWYLAVTELPLSYGAADVGDDKLRIVPVGEDKRIQARLIEAGREFWQEHVEKGIPPEPLGIEQDYRALQRVWPKTIPEPAIPITEKRAAAVLSDFIAHRSREKEHKQAAEAAKQRLCAWMGEHEQATVGGWLLSWKAQTTHSIDVARLRRERPDIAKEFEKATEGRIFGAPKETT